MLREWHSLNSCKTALTAKLSHQQNCTISRVCEFSRSHSINAWSFTCLLRFILYGKALFGIFLNCQLHFLLTIGFWRGRSSCYWSGTNKHTVGVCPFVSRHVSLQPRSIRCASHVILQSSAHISVRSNFHVSPQLMSVAFPWFPPTVSLASPHCVSNIN